MQSRYFAEYQVKYIFLSASLFILTENLNLEVIFDLKHRFSLYGRTISFNLTRLVVPQIVSDLNNRTQHGTQYRFM